MCLIIDQLEPKVADKDIVCYKMVTKSRIKGVYISEYRRFKYITEKLYTNNIDIKNSEALLHTIYRKDTSLTGIYSISGFMFHSYQSPYKYSLRADTIVKCVIPKGAYYFEGGHNGRWGYASSQIKILEEI